MKESPTASEPERQPSREHLPSIATEGLREPPFYLREKVDFESWPTGGEQALSPRPRPRPAPARAAKATVLPTG